MKNRYFIIGGISSVLIYISIIIIIMIYIQQEKPKKKYISPPKNSAVVVSLASNKSIKKVAPKKTLKKVIKKHKPKNKPKPKKIKKHKHKPKHKAKPKKIIKPKSKPKKIVKSKKIEKKKVAIDDLFKNIDTNRAKKKNLIKTTDKPKSSKSDLKNKMDAYSAKVTSILYDGFPEQERFAGNQIDIRLTIYQSGRFRFQVTKYSSNTEFNEILIQYLEQLQSIGFDRHSNPKPYKFNIEFIAKE
ncbi:TonB-like; putative TolA function [hydrothermal vent metagenome]|uniref:TonB-like putative TolA function n=1 Tax=hydrothermal vent metagenome TaxID=652676 RepID=A0A1W1EHV3_9ZZZZ